MQQRFPPATVALQTDHYYSDILYVLYSICRLWFRCRGCFSRQRRSRKSKAARRESKKNGAAVTIDASAGAGGAQANGLVPPVATSLAGADSVNLKAANGFGGVSTNGTSSVNASLDTTASGPPPALYTTAAAATTASSAPPTTSGTSFPPQTTARPFSQSLHASANAPSAQAMALVSPARIHVRGAKHSQSTREGGEGSVFTGQPTAPAPPPGVQRRVAALHHSGPLSPSASQLSNGAGTSLAGGGARARSPGGAHSYMYTTSTSNSMLSRVAIPPQPQPQPGGGGPAVAFGQTPVFLAARPPTGARSPYLGPPPAKPPRSRVQGSPGPTYQTSRTVTGYGFNYGYAAQPQPQPQPLAGPPVTGTGTQSLDRLHALSPHERTLLATEQTRALSPPPRLPSEMMQQQQQRGPQYLASAPAATPATASATARHSASASIPQSGASMSGTSSSLPRSAPSPAPRPLSPVHEMVDGVGGGGGVGGRLSRGATPTSALRASTPQPHGVNRVASPAPATASIFVSAPQRTLQKCVICPFRNLYSLLLHSSRVNKSAIFHILYSTYCKLQRTQLYL